MPHLPLTSPYLPMRRRPGLTRDPRRRWAIAGSVLLHLLALAALLVTRAPEPPMPIAPSYDLIFDNGGSSTPPTAPDQALDTPPEAPAADLPPTPNAEPPAAQASPKPPAPEPPVSTPDLAEPEPSPAPDIAVEPAEPPQPQPIPQPEPEPAPAPNPEPPAVRLAEPEPPAPSVSPPALAPDLPPMVPLPPLPPAPTPPRPRQQALPRPAPGAFAAPIDLNFGRAPSPRTAGSSRAIDFSLGAPKPGPNKSEAFFDIRAANIGADWAQGLAVYWRQHRYYPQQAAQNGEDGTVEIQIVVNRLGRVESVEIERRSGSPWLDMAAVGTWRNAQLAPLPAENTDRTITIPLTINYLLIR
jgi:TonB family protein